MREGSAPNFAPPVEEGLVLSLEDEKGVVTDFEFLGIIIHGEQSFGFFFPFTDESEVGGDGEVLILEVTEFDDDGYPLGFELLDDEVLAEEIYQEFKVATKDLYDFE